MYTDVGPEGPTSPKNPQDKISTSPSSPEGSLRHDLSHQVSFKNPIYSILRANPFSEVTDLICRLPLPTLFYRPEAIHLENLMRNQVRLWNTLLGIPHIFKGHIKHSEHNKNRYALHHLYPYLEMISFHGQNG